LFFEHTILFCNLSDLSLSLKQQFPNDNFLIRILSHCDFVTKIFEKKSEKKLMLEMFKKVRLKYIFYLLCHSSNLYIMNMLVTGLFVRYSRYPLLPIKYLCNKMSLSSMGVPRGWQGWLLPPSPWPALAGQK
jgi:hypothetical protein